jgi:hypothetical protein
MLPIFDEPTDSASDASSAARPMTPAQREGIRKAFASLGIADASSQFAIIENLTGQRVTRVHDVTSQRAAALLPLLVARVSSGDRVPTGNAWTDRTEDTWIDKL